MTNHETNPTTATEDKIQLHIFSREETLQEKIEVDFYDAMRRLFDAPIIFLTGVAMVPMAFAQWLGSENKKQTSTNNFGVSPLTVFGGIVFLILFFYFSIGKNFVPEGKILFRHYMQEQGIVDPELQQLLEKGCIDDGGTVVDSTHRGGYRYTILPGGNQCSYPPSGQ